MASQDAPLANTATIHYPRMYLTHAYNVLSGVTKDHRYHSVLNEIADAIERVAGFEKNGLTLYDRVYICKKMVIAHFSRRNYFFFLCRRAGVPKAIIAFFSSHKKYASFTWPGTKIRVYLIKVKNIYTLRWEVETSFRDLTETLKVEQWHSRSLNGILQELFVSFWLWNYLKIQTYLRTKNTENPYPYNNTGWTWDLK